MIKENNSVKLLKFIKDNYCEEEEVSFCDGLTYLREQTCLVDDIGDEFLIHLNKMLKVVKKNSHRAVIIETIVEIECFEFHNNQELLDEYIIHLSEGATTNIKAAQCLNAFINSGADENEVFYKVIKNLDKRHVVEALIYVHITKDKLTNITNEVEPLLNELETSRKISERSCVIAPFLLLVHPLCLEYGTNSYLSFNYYSAKSAIYDWGWYEPNGARYLVNKGIVTEKEAEILQRLGNLLRSNIDLNSKEIRELYYEFFKDKNPFDSMFILPKEIG